MSKQGAFFLSKYEIFQQEHPEKFIKKPFEKKPPKVYDCETCGLWRKCRHPKIQRYGKGRKRILLIGLCPGPTEDRIGVPFVGGTGALIKRIFDSLDVDFDVDCVRTNLASCYPGRDERGRNKEPTKDQIKCCSGRLEKDIQETQPTMIILLGTLAIKALLQVEGSFKFSADMMHGKVIPWHKRNCWVGCSYHPSFFLHRKNSSTDPDDEIVFKNDIANILSYLDKPLPQPLTTEGNECITNVDEAISMLEYFCDSEKPVAFDYEANDLSPYSDDPKMLSVSLSNDPDSGIFIPIEFKDVFNLDERARISIALKNFLQSDARKVIQNYNMEELWSRNILLQSVNNFIWDTMVTAHVLNCHPRTTGLGFQAFEMTGHEYKHMVKHEDIENEPLENLCNYNCWDARYTIMSYYRQKAMLKGNLVKFNDFFTSSLPVLANLKDRGVRIDLKALDELDKDFSAGIEDCKNTILNDAGVKQFEEENNKKFDLNSPAQVGKVLYDIYNVEKLKKTPTKKGSTDKEALQAILDATKNSNVATIIRSLFTYRKIIKVLERIAEYRRLVDHNQYVHPSYSLNIARSYRSSSGGPNIQNVFEHDKMQRQFRKCIVPRPGNIFLEADYSGIEVRVIAMASKDPELARQIIQGIDTHIRWAARIYQKPEDQITYDERYKGKNGFIFASFYGSIAASVARNFPEVSPEHMGKVQEAFWNEYQYVKEWQLRTIGEYKKNGYIELLTGARRPGPLSINMIYNTPIQGVGFHLCLDSLNRIDEEMRKRNLKSNVNIEVHDSIDTDTVPEEIEEVIDIAEKIMCSKRFDWQANIPLEVKWKAGHNWYEMEDL